ncbi:HEAT repeat-containing protein 6 [Leptidea sinapis]|uniref:HEAT repeat-containing protein 6 n=1 Tax=Leptidea sinapis TaxID=189913 RepID=UPI00211F637B|nr:HEAT repeat-containing protein 6 [Leptidea sinapis]
MANLKITEQFSGICKELLNILTQKESNSDHLNLMIDELNSKPYNGFIFVKEHDATVLIESLCTFIKPSEITLSAKASHLMNNIINKQNLKFRYEVIHKVILWHSCCLKVCSPIILLDILHNMHCILQGYSSFTSKAGIEFFIDLIGKKGLLLKFLDLLEEINTDTCLSIHLMTLKVMLCLITAYEEDKFEGHISTIKETKENVSKIILAYLFKTSPKVSDEFKYCKVVISAFAVLTFICFTQQNIKILLPETIGICRYFMLYGLRPNNCKPEKIMPSQQTVAIAPVKTIPKGGKKQKQRKQRNSAIDSLKKEIPVSDRSLMKDVESFENGFDYQPASKNYLEPPKANNFWVVTSDSDMSDAESNRDAKLIALQSRVRQSAANLLLVIIKIKEKREIVAYWWALLPNTPTVPGIFSWREEDYSKQTLAYCVINDRIASSRVSALSVILALLSGSKMYLGQAEICKKVNASFIPFSVSLGFVVSRMHDLLNHLLNINSSVVESIVTLKCCAALVQATPYTKMDRGLAMDLVGRMRRFLVHRDKSVQVAALIAMGCVLSIDPKVDEVLQSIQKDTAKETKSNKESETPNDDCDDFEEGYSDDEVFTMTELSQEQAKFRFNTWILDICFRNLGWICEEKKMVKCSPSTIPVMLESLQVLSAIAYHHLAEVLKPNIMQVADILCEILGHDHQDVVLHTVKLISVIGDAIQKLERSNSAPPLNHCVYMWEKLLTPLSLVLQNHESSPSKGVVCDCIANIGENSFKQLPDRLQRVCCALLMGLCSDEESSVRAAAVRALAMTVMYRTLREDMCFVSDCGENILRALAEPSIHVRSKAAWALGNLSDALVINMDEPDLETIDDDLVLRLLEASVHAAADNDKVKMSATRSLGNLLRLIGNEILTRYTRLKPLCETAIKKLLDCACKVSSMKVRWNACYALGNAMKNECLYTCLNGWQCEVFTSLCSLAQDCKNLKVRINAAVALRAPATRHMYARHYVFVWKGVLTAMENAANFDDYTEYKHKDNLIEQLCVTLAHMCCILEQSDLGDIVDSLVFHVDCAKGLYTQLYQKLPPENPSCMKMLQAAKHVTVDLTSLNELQSQSLGMLQDMFIWDV